MFVKIYWSQFCWNSNKNTLSFPFQTTLKLTLSIVYFNFRGATKNTSNSSTIGLWRVCRFSGSKTTCLNIPAKCEKYIGVVHEVCQKMVAARAFMTIACFLSGLSAVCLFTYIIMNTDSNRVLFVISKVLPILSFIAGIIGLAIGIAYVTTGKALKLSNATFVAIAALVANMIGAILVIVARWLAYLSLKTC